MLIIACLTMCKLILVYRIGQAESAKLVTTDVTNCRNGTFYSRDYMMCVPCSTCDAYSAVVSPCTENSDTVCIKCADTSQPDLLNDPTCKQCPPCKAGEYMEANCTSNTSTVCRSCPEGSFNSLASYKTYCLPCASCTNRVMIKDCTATMDTECGSCKIGYFKDVNRNQCNRCASCAPGQLAVEGCKNGLPGKLCSEYFFFRTQYVDVPGDDENNTISTEQAFSTTVETLSTSEETLIEIRVSSSITLIDSIVITGVCLVTLVLIAIIIVTIYKFSSTFKKSGKLNNDDNLILYFNDDNSDTVDLIKA